jgi:hypothetical protein
MKFTKILSAVFKLLFAGRDRDRERDRQTDMVKLISELFKVFLFLNMPELFETCHHKNSFLY